MSNADPCAAREGVQGAPRPGLNSDVIVKSGAPLPLAVPASDTAAAATAVEGAAAATAQSAASAPEPPNSGVERCPQDPKASGLDVLVGAVDIVGAADIEVRGQMAGPAATGHDGCTERAATHASRASGLGVLSEEASGSDRADSKGVNSKEEETAYRPLPRAFAGHAPSTRTEGGGSGGFAVGTLPGFSAINYLVEANDASVSTPGTTTANSSRERRFDDGYPPAAPPPSLGPTARDMYATMTGAAWQQAAPRTGFPGLAPQKVVHYDDEGFRLSPIPADPSSAAGSAASLAKPTRKAAKKTKALQTKAVKTKPKPKPKPKPPKKKTTAKPKSGKHRARRRGPAGQSHFKGVCLTPSGTWRAVIYVDRTQKYLGVFDNEFDAARAYDAAAVLYFPDAPPPLNNPDDVERQLNAISASDGKAIATAGTPELPPGFKPPRKRVEGGYGPRMRP